jgi:hypothetical protein
MRAFGTDKWLAIVLSLPTSNATLRTRIWRALKGLGCAVLRDGVYLLPAGRGLRQALRMYVEEVRQGGGSAFLLNVSSAAGEERAEFQGLFDRRTEYQGVAEKIDAFKAGFAVLDTVLGRRQLKALRRDLEAIMAVDYFPGPAKEEVEDRLAEVETLFFASLSPGEPRMASGEIAPRERAAYLGRVWATRQHVWVDRLASAWLVRRFIDADARFVWLENPENCPAGAVGFDFDGAEFTHVGKQVTFEVLLVAFGLDKDLHFSRIAAVVHFLDAGGATVAEAPGVEMILSGLRRQCVDDDALLVQAMGVFDSMYAAFAE